MKKQLKNNEKTTRYLDSLPKIYLIVYWARCGVMGFPYTKKVDKDGMPLVYKYYDGNGTCDLWELCRIDHTTTGIILGFTTDEKVAQKLAEGYNKIKEKEITTKTTEFVAPIEKRIIFRVKPNLIGDFVNRYCTEEFEWNARAMVYEYQDEFPMGKLWLYPRTMDFALTDYHSTTDDLEKAVREFIDAGYVEKITIEYRKEM